MYLSIYIILNVNIISKTILIFKFSKILFNLNNKISFFFEFYDIFIKRKKLI
jgi:hypothetical protein